jgi:hypothetical protein
VRASLADPQAADRDAATPVDSLSHQQMNCLHQVEFQSAVSAGAVSAAISSVPYQEPAVSMWRLCYFLDPHNRIVVRLPRSDVYLFTRKKAVAFGPVDLEIARLNLVNPGTTDVGPDT